MTGGGELNDNVTDATKIMGVVKIMRRDAECRRGYQKRTKNGQGVTHC